MQHRTQGVHGGEQEPGGPGHRTRNTTHGACTTAAQNTAQEEQGRDNGENRTPKVENPGRQHEAGTPGEGMERAEQRQREEAATAGGKGERKGREGATAGGVEGGRGKGGGAAHRGAKTQRGRPRGQERGGKRTEGEAVGKGFSWGVPAARRPVNKRRSKGTLDDRRRAWVGAVERA